MFGIVDGQCSPPRKRSNDMNIIVTITDKRVNDLLFGHLGKMSDWLHLVSGKIDDGVKAVWDREKDAEGSAKGRGSFTREQIEKGLATMAEKAPYQWAQFMLENDDDVTFDCAWQFIIFGKEIYG
jgi:hypothetical protein